MLIILTIIIFMITFILRLIAETLLLKSRVKALEEAVAQISVNPTEEADLDKQLSNLETQYNPSSDNTVNG